MPIQNPSGNPSFMPIQNPSGNPSSLPNQNPSGNSSFLPNQNPSGNASSPSHQTQSENASSPIARDQTQSESDSSNRDQTSSEIISSQIDRSPSENSPSENESTPRNCSSPANEIEMVDSPSGDNDPPSDNESAAADYHDLLKTFSSKWLLSQLTHNVSLTAANAFWQLSLNFLPVLLEAKENSLVKKNTPGFIHQKRKLYDEMCPKVHMKFVFLNRITNEIETIECEKDPSRRFPKSTHIKLYEEAHIKVNIPTNFFEKSCFQTNFLITEFSTLKFVMLNILMFGEASRQICF